MQMLSSPASTERRRAGRPSRSDSERDGAVVRERLLDAATALAIERGFDGAALREIADRAGVSSGMVAYYFGDRRGLYEAMSERAFGRISSELTDAMDALPPGADPIETLIRIHSAAIAADPWIPQLVAREVLASEGSLRERFKELIGNGPLSLMRGVIENTIEHGLLRQDLDPTLCVMTLLSMTAFPYLMAPVLGDLLGIELDDAFRERLVEHNLALITRGLRAREEQLT